MTEQIIDQSKNESIFRKALPLFAISLINGGISPINAVVQTIADVFSVSLSTARMVSTLPNLITMLVTMLMGNLVERKLSYKSIMLTGIILFLFGGLAPLFVNNIVLLLLLRAIFGIGMGCFGILNSLYLRVFDRSISEKMIGYGWAILSASTILMKIAAGALGAIDWHYAFLPYNIGFLSLIIFLIFFKEPEYPVSIKTERKKSSSVNWTPKLVLYVVLKALSPLFIYPVLTGMSTFIAQKGVGGAALAGLAGSIYTLAGVFMGSIISNVSGTLKRFTAPVCFYFIPALGFLTLLASKGPVLICLGSFLCGVANYAILPVISTYQSFEVDPASLPVVTSLTWAIHNASMFLSTYMMVFADRIFKFYDSSDAGRLYLLGLILFGILGVVFCVVDIRPDAMKVQTNTEHV